MEVLQPPSKNDLFHDFFNVNLFIIKAFIINSIQMEKTWMYCIFGAPKCCDGSSGNSFSTRSWWRFSCPLFVKGLISLFGISICLRFLFQFSQSCIIWPPYALVSHFSAFNTLNKTLAHLIFICFRMLYVLLYRYML